MCSSGSVSRTEIAVGVCDSGFGIWIGIRIPNSIPECRVPNPDSDPPRLLRDLPVAARWSSGVAMGLTYFFANTAMIAGAIGLCTGQSVWRIWKTDFVTSAPSYVLGAVSAAVVIAAVESSGYWLTALLTATPLYLTYNIYKAGVES